MVQDSIVAEKFMDAALFKPKQFIISAEDLWDTEFNESDFECHGCGVDVIPASYTPDNKKRPYFRLYPNATHHNNCDVDGEVERIKRAKTSKISTVDGFPVPYPNRLILKDIREASDSSQEDLDLRVKKQNKPNNEGASGVSNRKHNRTVTTIRLIAKHFSNYPFDRHLSLKIPGLSGQTYKDIFQKITPSIDRATLRNKILYGSLHFKPTEIFEDYCDVTLSQGIWENNALKNPFKVRIHNKMWSTKMKKAIKNEISVAREEAKLNRNQGNKTVKAWLFFIGLEEQTEEFIIHVRDKRMICCIIIDDLLS
jgi:hypothetical protein